MKIVICGSMKFSKEMLKIKEKLNRKQMSLIEINPMYHGNLFKCNFVYNMDNIECDNKENKEIIFAIHNGRDEYNMFNDALRLNLVMNQMMMDL